MLLLFTTPAYPLNKYVELFTFYKDYFPEHTIERLLPEGVVEVIIDLTESPSYIYDNQTLAKIQTCKKVWVSGMRRKFISISAGNSVAGGSSMFVIRFKPGMAYPFLQIPVSAIKEKVVDGELIMKKEILELREKIIEAETPQQKFQATELYLMKRISGSKKINPAVEYLAKSILENPTASSIKLLTQKTGYSSKHLISLFNKYVGIRPKDFMRIFRFQKTILDIENQRVIDWHKISFDSGYYDQAHFIHDFKRFTGFTPTEYINIKKELANYIPIG